MKISEAAQEQLELLWIQTEETQSGTALLATPADDYSELVDLGLAILKDNQPTLTPTGHVQAALAIRRHRLAERLLADILVTEASQLDDRACGLEHALFDGVDESICTLLGHPQVCPHGKPIPPGVCCQQARTSVGQLVAPLKELKRGVKGKISYIHMHNPQHLQKLMAMGVLPGVSITVLETYPSFVFEAGYSQFAVDEDIAAEIYVRLSR